MTETRRAAYRDLTAFGMLASQVTMTGAQARLALALPSTWFTSSVLSLLPDLEGGSASAAPSR